MEGEEDYWWTATPCFVIDARYLALTGQTQFRKRGTAVGAAGNGLCGVALMFLQFTPLLPTAVGLYYLGFVPLGLALARQR